MVRKLPATAPRSPNVRLAAIASLLSASVCAANVAGAEPAAGSPGGGRPAVAAESVPAPAQDATAPGATSATGPSPSPGPASPPTTTTTSAPSAGPPALPGPSATTAPAAAPAAAAPAPIPVPVPASRGVTSPGEAVVHIAVSHQDAWLEMRSYVDGGAFLRICRAPCDIKLHVEGREARVTAAGMTTSNVFRFDGGDGTAGVRVDGGSATSRRAGIIALAIGIPVALAGMGLFAQGKVKDNNGLTAAGIAGLSAGGLSIAVSLPLLLIGTTHVKNAKGSLIAFGQPVPTL